MEMEDNIVSIIFVCILIGYLSICALSPFFTDWVNHKTIIQQQTIVHDKIVYKISIDSVATDSLNNWKK